MGLENNIPEGWLESTLGEICENISRRFNFKEKEDVIFVNTGDVSNGKFLHHNRVSKEGLPGQAKKAVEYGDILYSEIRPANKRFALVDFDSKDYVVSTKFMVLKKNDRVDLDFLYLFLTSNKVIATFQAHAEARSGTFPQITFDTISYDEILIPPIPEQKAIAKVLTAFDDKIELLQAQNITLETISQTIFKEWFGKYQIGDELPDGWRFGCLGDIAVNHSKTYKLTDKKVVFINTGDVLEGKFLHKNEISPVGLPGQAKKVIELHDILYSEIRPKNKRFAFVDFDTSNYVVSTKFMIIRTKLDFSPFILYLILKNQVTINEFNSIAESRSGTFPQITFDSIKDFPIVIPSIETKQKFESVLMPLMAKQKENDNQIQSLSKTRDTLLPKLMSGQVRVNNIKQLASA